MHYVKQFNINGVATKQVACIELQGAPNAATEGAVGVLGMDMTSPTHDVYRCVAVNGSVYTWELLSAGMSILSATITGEGGESKTFPYDTLLVPDKYLIKAGDLIMDSEGYLYQIKTIGADSCDARYAGTHIGSGGSKVYKLVVANGKLQLVTESGAVLSSVDYVVSDESTLYRNSATGATQVRGVNTINTNSPLRFFVGTRAEYDALPNKDNVFALTTDDDSKEVFDALKRTVAGLADDVSKMNHTVYVGDVSTDGTPITVVYGRGYIIFAAATGDSRCSRENMTFYMPSAYLNDTISVVTSSMSGKGHYCEVSHLASDDSWKLKFYDGEGTAVNMYKVYFRQF